MDRILVFQVYGFLQARDGTPSWSRGGKWIYFYSTRSGEQQLWKMPANGGEASQLTRTGGLCPIESADGRFLYYAKGNTVPTALWRVPVGGGDEIQVLESLSLFRDFAVVDEGIYFTAAQDLFTAASASIQFLSFATGAVTPVATTEKYASYSLDVSPDRRWIAYTQYDQVNSDLMLVENFR